MLNLATRYSMDLLSNHSGSQTLQLNQKYSNKKYGSRNNLVTKNHRLKQCFYHNFENYDLKAPNLLYSLIFLKSFSSHSYAILYAIRMSIVCTRMSLVCHSYVTRMYSYVIRMTLICARILYVCTCMSFVRHSYVLVCYLYVTCMYLYVMACPSCVFVCNGMSLICCRMSSEGHSYIIHMSLVCTRMSSVCRS